MLRLAVLTLRFFETFGLALPRELLMLTAVLMAVALALAYVGRRIIIDLMIPEKIRRFLFVPVTDQLVRYPSFWENRGHLCERFVHDIELKESFSKTSDCCPLGR